MRVLSGAARALLVVALGSLSVASASAATVEVGARYADGTPLIGPHLCAGEGCLANAYDGGSNGTDSGGNAMITVPDGTVVEFGDPYLYRGGNRVEGSSFYRIVATETDRQLFTFPSALTPGIEPANGPEESRLVDMIQTARRSAGVQLLEERAALSIAADQHASWMARGGTPGKAGEYASSVYQRVLYAGALTFGADDVVAVDAASADAAFAKLMGDPATRATILDSDWAGIGVGAVRGRWDVTFVSTLPGCAYGCPFTTKDPQAGAFAVPPVPAPAAAPATAGTAGTPSTSAAPGPAPVGVACRVGFRSPPKAVRRSARRVRISTSIRSCPGVRATVRLQVGSTVRRVGVRRSYALTTRGRVVRIRLIAGGRTVDARSVRVRSR